MDENAFSYSDISAIPLKRVWISKDGSIETSGNYSEYNTIYSPTTEISISKVIFSYDETFINNDENDYKIIESIFNILDSQSINRIKKSLFTFVANYIEKHKDDDNYQESSKDLCLNIYNKFDRCGFYNYFYYCFQNSDEKQSLPKCTFELPPIELNDSILNSAPYCSVDTFTVHTDKKNDLVKKENQEKIVERLKATPVVEPFFVEFLNDKKFIKNMSAVLGPSEAFLRSLCPVAEAEETNRGMRYAAALRLEAAPVPATAFPGESNANEYGLLTAVSARIEELDAASAVVRAMAMPLSAEQCLVSARLSAAEDTADFLAPGVRLVRAAEEAAELNGSKAAKSALRAAAIAVLARSNRFAPPPSPMAARSALSAVPAALGLSPGALRSAAEAMALECEFPGNDAIEHFGTALRLLLSEAGGARHGGAPVPSLWAVAREGVGAADRFVVRAAEVILRLAAKGESAAAAVLGRDESPLLKEIRSAVKSDDAALELADEIARTIEAAREAKEDEGAKIIEMLSEKDVLLWSDIDTTKIREEIKKIYNIQE